MDLKHQTTLPGDVVIPPYGDKEDEYATIVFYDEENEEYVIGLDDEDFTNICIHESQIDDLIVALETVKEFK